MTVWQQTRFTNAKTCTHIYKHSPKKWHAEMHVSSTVFVSLPPTHKNRHAHAHTRFKDHLWWGLWRKRHLAQRCLPVQGNVGHCTGCQCNTTNTGANSGTNASNQQWTNTSVCLCRRHGSLQPLCICARQWFISNRPINFRGDNYSTFSHERFLE